MKAALMEVLQETDFKGRQVRLYHEASRVTPRTHILHFHKVGANYDSVCNVDIYDNGLVKIRVFRVYKSLDREPRILRHYVVSGNYSAPTAKDQFRTLFKRVF